jgi:REP element-mobilizing transposase RayT
MSHSYTNLAYHIIFATKGRERWIDEPLRPWLYAQIASVINEKKGVCLLVNGVADHVHILAKLRPDHRVCDVVGAVKATSSGRVHRFHPRLAHIAWQSGYGAFTVSHPDTERVRAYIADQEEHHRGRTIDDEFLSLYRENGIEVDENTMWD